MINSANEAEAIPISYLMYPVPKNARHVIEEWAEELASYFGCAKEVVLGSSEQWLSFPNESVRIELMDGSFMEFKYAFHIVSEAKKAIAVFSEHCGHHVLPYHSAKVFSNGVLVYEQQGA